MDRNIVIGYFSSNLNRESVGQPKTAGDRTRKTFCWEQLPLRLSVSLSIRRSVRFWMECSRLKVDVRAVLNCGAYLRYVDGEKILS